MKKLVCLILLTAVFTGCQKKQWYGSCPEIDLVKKVDDSFLNNDMAVWRAAYADTARIFFNDMIAPPLSPDTLALRLKDTRESYGSLKMSRPIYEMIVTDDGDQWVHRWCQWEATTKNGKAYTWASQASFLVSDGKIRMAGYVVNSLPGYLVNQPEAPATVETATPTK